MRESDSQWLQTVQHLAALAVDAITEHEKNTLIKAAFIKLCLEAKCLEFSLSKMPLKEDDTVFWTLMELYRLSLKKLSEIKAIKLHFLPDYQSYAELKTEYKELHDFITELLNKVKPLKPSELAHDHEADLKKQMRYIKVVTMTLLLTGLALLAPGVVKMDPIIITCALGFFIMAATFGYLLRPKKEEQPQSIKPVATQAPLIVQAPTLAKKRDVGVQTEPVTSNHRNRGAWCVQM